MAGEVDVKQVRYVQRNGRPIRKLATMKGVAP
jgi:hypothetical protein